MINNWNSILSTYQSQTGDLTYAFTNEMKQYNDIVNAFYDYQLQQINSAAVYSSYLGLVKAVEVIAQVILLTTAPAAVFNAGGAYVIAARAIQLIIFDGLASTYTEYCDDKSIQSMNQFGSYEQNICNDFHNGRWTSFANFFQDVCSTNLGFEENSQLSTFYGNLCKTDKAVNPSLYPDGVESSGIDQSMFQFLQSNKAYLTFGSQTTTSLTWTSTVTNSLTHTTTFSNNLDNELNPEGKTKLIAGIKLQATMGFKLGTSYKVDIGQTSTGTESSLRTTVINLGDADQGK